MTVLPVFVSGFVVPVVNQRAGFEARTIGAGLKFVIAKTTELELTPRLVEIALSDSISQFAALADTFKKRLACFAIGPAAADVVICVHNELLKSNVVLMSRLCPI